MAVSPASTLAALFPSMAMARLVVFFLVHPGGRWHLRELMRRTGLSSASPQHELRRLAEMGALRREEEGGRAFFRAEEEHPAWRAWVLLLRSGAKPADVLREALVDAPGLQGALVFGSWARGDAREESDVDLLLVGDEEARLRAGRLLVEAELLVGRAVDVAGYDAAEIAARARSGSSFVRQVLAGPHQWLRGGPALVPRAEVA